METKKLICINCPLGCSLEVKIDGGEYNITGNSCNKGIEYAISEIESPRRILTTSVFVNNGVHTTVSVKTSSEIPKDMIFRCIQELAKLKVEAPVKIGDIIVKNILNTGADITATRTVNARPRQ